MIWYTINSLSAFSHHHFDALLLILTMITRFSFGFMNFRNARISLLPFRVWELGGNKNIATSLTSSSRLGWYCYIGNMPSCTHSYLVKQGCMSEDTLVKLFLCLWIWILYFCSCCFLRVFV